MVLIYGHDPAYPGFFHQINILGKWAMPVLPQPCFYFFMVNAFLNLFQMGLTSKLVELNHFNIRTLEHWNIRTFLFYYSLKPGGLNPCSTWSYRHSYIFFEPRCSTLCLLVIPPVLGSFLFSLQVVGFIVCCLFLCYNLVYKQGLLMIFCFGYDQQKAVGLKNELGSLKFLTYVGIAQDCKKF